jgi:hypothetical protein
MFRRSLRLAQVVQGPMERPTDLGRITALFAADGSRECHCGKYREGAGQPCREVGRDALTSRS